MKFRGVSARRVGLRRIGRASSQDGEALFGIVGQEDLISDPIDVGWVALIGIELQTGDARRGPVVGMEMVAVLLKTHS